MINEARVALERERRDIAAAASKITDLWWSKPDENGHLKTQAVINILQRQFWGWCDSDLESPVAFDGAD
jgi:hypothetical protein